MNLNVSWPNKSQFAAIGRHAISYSAGMVVGSASLLAFATLTHIITTDQASQVTAALTDISTGVKSVVQGLASIYGGLASLASLGAAVWAARSASSRSQAASIVKQYPDTVIVTDAALAKSVPSDNVVSNLDNKVVSK